MVLVTVGEDEADDVAPFLDQIADVRQDQIDAGQMLFGREGHAAIDDEPLAPRAVADAVDREIHPDLADAAERREHELASHQSTCPAVGGRMGGGAPASGNTSPAVIACKPPSARRSSNRPCSSSASKRPKKLAAGEPHPHLAADAGGAGHPVGANGGKAGAFCPLCEPFHHPAG